MKDDKVYLQHILDAVGRIEEYTAPGPVAFLASKLHPDAVLRNLQTLAEASQRVSPELKLQHPEVDWKALSAFRNVLVHDYLGVDIRLVHHNITRDLPILKQAVRKLLAVLGP